MLFFYSSNFCPYWKMEIILQSNTRNLYSKGLVTSGSHDRRRIDGNSNRPSNVPIVPCIAPAFLRMLSHPPPSLPAETRQVRNVAVLQALSQAAQQSLQAGHLKGKGLAMIAKAFAELAPSQNVEMGIGEGDGFQLPCFSFWWLVSKVLFLMT